MKYMAFRMCLGGYIVEEVLPHDEYCKLSSSVVGGLTDPPSDDAKSKTYWHRSGIMLHCRTVPIDGNVFDTREDAQADCDRLNSTSVC